MGDTVNVASRLEQAAPIGGVLIAHDTYRHIRGVFEVSVREPIAVRGKSEPMQTYVVRGVKPRAFRIGARGVEGVETRTVGRDRELARLHAAYERVADGQGLRAALVIGEAGIGKSRLLYDLRVWLELRSEKIRLVEGRARVGRQGTTLGLIRDMLTRRFEIRDSDSAADVDRKLREGFGEALMPADVDTVAAWLGLGTTSRETTGSEHLAALGQAALVTWLRRVTNDMPTVILLEDLHWADRESLGVVWTIAEELATNQLLVVGLSRPGTDLDGPWFDEYPFAERITLDPLDRATSETLVHEVLQRVDHVPDSIVDLIVGRSDGNPFFVEEIVKMLRDNGVIIDSEANADADANAHGGAGASCRPSRRVRRPDDHQRRSPGPSRSARRRRTGRPAACGRHGPHVLGRCGGVDDDPTDDRPADGRACALHRRAARTRLPAGAFVVPRQPGVRVQARAAPRRGLRDRPAP